MLKIAQVSPRGPLYRHRTGIWKKSMRYMPLLGGVHPTLLPDEANRHADSVVVGYAEDSWPLLLRDFHAGKLAPLPPAARAQAERASPS